VPKLSRFPGVFWHPRLKKWVVSVAVLVGTFDSEDEAGAARRSVDLAAERIRRFVVECANGSDQVRRGGVV
jgi:hypothetical protein